MSEWNEENSDLEQNAEIEELPFEENEKICFNAQEDVFYGNQQIFNSRLDEYEKNMNCEYLSEEEREYAKQQYNDVYTEKRDAIDKWKEKYGQYDEERTELRIGEKSEEIKEQESYDITEHALEEGTQESQTADVEITEQNETLLENMSYDELKNKYNDVCTHNTALGDQYVKYDQQIAEISRNKTYYSSEKEWNCYIDEKNSAQNDVSARRNQIQSEMRKLEKEMDKRKKMI